VVIISVYKNACFVSSLKKKRQWRSVQSIIGATEKTGHKLRERSSQRAFIAL
jgi:hypothetical protein